MISDFREGGRFSKIGESLCKRAFSIGEKIGDRGKGGGQKLPKNIGYHLWMAPKELERALRILKEP